MKLNELFKAADHGGAVRDRNHGMFEIEKKIGDRVIRFVAHQDRITWEVLFSELTDDVWADGEQKVKTDLTGSGNEVEVFQFVLNCFRSLIKEHNPKRMEFSAKKSEESRVKLYRRMVKRFADAYLVREFETGLGRAEKYILFELNRRVTVDEGAMKRSDPYISGEQDYPVQKDAKFRSDLSPHKKMLANTAQKAGKTLADAEAAWEKVKGEVSKDLQNYWAIVQFRFKRELGLV
jgi:hypothetical protein